MRSKIQLVDLVKFNPNHFYLDFWAPANMYAIAGGMPSMVMSATGALGALAYFKAAGGNKNFYANNYLMAGRLIMGATLGMALGYKFFGDRQRLHNAWLSERLRRRYPECMDLHQTDLWKLKGVTAPHEFYQWK